MTTEDALLERRRNTLRGLRLYYDFPFHPVRGEGYWLWDAAGRRYLDAYNNVAQVGHCHPDVVAALARQAATLNTNTRYLLDGLVDYAERLVATMPAGLDAVIFTCTGSEANDLAWRLATNFTGHRGAITTRNAYHGNTTFLDLIDGSSIKTGREPVDWWATVPAPPDATDPRGDATPIDGKAYAAAFDGAIDRLNDRGHRPAAFYLDSFFCTDGVRLPAPGFLGPAIERLHAAGGVVIADEVQAGLARIGSHMWSFERLGLVPDMVVLGKPIGNGHPIGAIVARRDVVDAFYARDRYFNTFAGNPVSCAVGCAVLDVIERERLQANAARTGALLKRRLTALGERHPNIGAVRGQGLMLGVELVVDRTTRAPASREAKAVINHLVSNGVIVGLTGPDRNARNILKIRPPLVFDATAVELLVSALDQALSTVR